MKKKPAFSRYIRKLEGVKSPYPEGLVTIYELHEKWGLKEGDTYYWWYPMSGGFRCNPNTFKEEYYRIKEYVHDSWATTDPEYNPNEK